MQEPLENPELPENKPQGSRITVIIGAVVAAAILVSLWFLFEPLQSRKTALQETISVKMNAAEQDYVQKIEVDNIAMSRAENFLHQEVTTLAGELHNGGSEPVQGVTLTAEFSDDMNQIVLRETRPVLGAALAPGERRAFEISFEHIPTSWNMQASTVRVTRLQLAPHKQ